MFPRQLRSRELNRLSAAASLIVALLTIGLSAASLRGQVGARSVDGVSEPRAAQVMSPVTGVYAEWSDAVNRDADVAAPPGGEGQVHIRGESPWLPDAVASAAAPAPRDVLPRPDLPSPSPARILPALSDTTIIPPDTMGAVGPHHIVTTLNGGVRIHGKASGATLSSVTMASFWSPLGVTSPFDPKTTYDPYNDRFILAAVSNARSSSSSVLVAISHTSDPTGGWWLYRFTACASACGATGTEWWADYPGLGFNRNWVAVTANMFGSSDNLFKESRMWVLDYPTARSGSAPSSLFVSLTDFTIMPTVTYSATEPTLYTVTHAFGSGAVYRLSTITGTPSTPVYTRGVQRSHTLVSSWSEAYVVGTDAAPQAPEPTTGLVRGVDQGDSRIMNAVFRNNAIWYAQTVALPAGTPTHTAAQWIKLSTAGADLDAGRIDVPSATATNGGRWYAYPSIAVNANNDVLVGFAAFSSAAYPSGGYAYRSASDAPGTMRDVTVFVNGSDFYYKTYSGTRNRWGDYTATVVDPSDDLSFWTIQESAGARVGSGNGSGRWTTTWAMVPPPTVPTRRAPPGDFDGDGRSDFSIFRPSNSLWVTLRSGGGTLVAQWGAPTDTLVPADYDGDGRTDVAIFRPSDSTWYIARSRDGSIVQPWGTSTDVPVPADYDGDGRADIAVYSPSNTTWYIWRSREGFFVQPWGAAGVIPVPADYDGDGRADIAVYQPSNFTWYIMSSSASWVLQPWGGAGAIPVPGDYDGDRRADIAVYVPSNGTWYVKASTGAWVLQPWGSATDIPVPSDYDGDGRTDIAVYRPSNGNWYVKSSAGAWIQLAWGIPSDVPINGR